MSIPTLNQIERNTIKGNLITDMQILFESEDEDYYKPVRINNVFDDNFIEYESNDDRNKTFSIEEYLKMKIRPYLCNMTNDLKGLGEWKTQFQGQSTFCLLKILTKHVPCIQRVITLKL